MSRGGSGSGSCINSNRSGSNGNNGSSYGDNSRIMGDSSDVFSSGVRSSLSRNPLMISCGIRGKPDSLATSVNLSNSWAMLSHCSEVSGPVVDDR